MEIRFLIFVFCLIILACQGCLRASWIAKPKFEFSRISVKNRWLIDNSDRIRIYHGFNAVQKGPPWYPQDLLNETKLRYYSQWGFNVVRLGAMWSGAEPADGAFNMTYLQILSEITTKLQKHGMYAILDMHQDVMSSKFGTYDGVPLWFINKLPPSPNLYPWPLPAPPAEWAAGYLAQAVGRAFQDIYSNKNGSLDHLSRFWQKIAEVFRNRKSILGYELINEPWVGDIYTDPSMLLPGEAGRRNLKPLYDKLNRAIRQVDNITLIFYEPVTFGIFLNGIYTGSGLDSVPGGDSYRNRSVFSYHYYCFILNTSTQHHRYVPWQQKLCDRILGPQVFAQVIKDIAKTGGGAFLTEFGLCEPDGKLNTTGTIECEFVLRQADEYLQSWTYWDSSFFDQEGHVKWNVVKPFARVYARAIAGVPIVAKFDLTSRTFHLKYYINFAITEPTEIFVPPLHYPDGFRVTVSPGLTWRFDSSDNTLRITGTSDSVNMSRKIVTVLVYPK